MGYKRAGMDVVAANDIDVEMAEQYKANFTPDHYLLGSITDILDDREHWSDLDILDGSPPCSAFSTASKMRGENWGQLKHYREGQQAQILDNLYGEFARVAVNLRPPVVLAENVVGLVTGAAKGYLVEAAKYLGRNGYTPQVFKLSARRYGVSQDRARIIMVAVRDDISTEKLPIPPASPTDALTVRQVCQLCADDPVEPDAWIDPEKEPITWEAVRRTIAGEAMFDAKIRTGSILGINYGTMRRNRLDRVSNSLVATNTVYHPTEQRNHSVAEMSVIGSWPFDYKWSQGTQKWAAYVIGMSVPPPLIEAVARQAAETWLGVTYG